MTAEEYSKQYDLAINFKIVAKQAFSEGLRQGKSQNQTEEFKRLKRELKKVKEENKWMKEVLYDPDRLTDWVCGS